MFLQRGNKTEDRIQKQGQEEKGVDEKRVQKHQEWFGNIQPLHQKKI